MSFTGMVLWDFAVNSRGIVRKGGKKKRNAALVL
jgi:hypothetical protein